MTDRTRPSLPPRRRPPDVPPAAPADVEPGRFSAELLAKYGARVLDPTTVSLIDGQPPLRPTVYRPDRLLVHPAPADPRLREAIEAAAAASGLQLRPDLSAARSLAGRGVDEHGVVHRVRLVPVPPSSGDPTALAPAPDAITVLQRARQFLQRPTGGIGASLEHLLTSATMPALTVVAGGIGGNPYNHVGGKAADAATVEYALPGRGGRVPVMWVGPEPFRGPDPAAPARRPRVAVLDTGVGEHPWHAAVVRRALPDSPPDGELTGIVDDELTGQLGADAGHGTFIAGLIRQACPDVDILSVRVMDADGVVGEEALLAALQFLLAAHLAGPSDDPADGPIDVVSLSLGYYHESPVDQDLDGPLGAVIAALTRNGVTVVCSAGNDATSRPLFPAAFAPWADGTVRVAAGCLPVISVGARNPDSSVALFSNAGDWVRALDYGASVVSTMPTTFDGGAGSAYRVDHGDGTVPRATIDPDSFRGGFASWSGTSFAAPILAGRLARYLSDHGGLETCAPPDGGLSRGWDAVSAVTGLQP